jgi:hypothetical protein
VLPLVIRVGDEAPRHLAVLAQGGDRLRLMHVVSLDGNMGFGPCYSTR